MYPQTHILVMIVFSHNSPHNSSDFQNIKSVVYHSLLTEKQFHKGINRTQSEITFDAWNEEMCKTEKT